MKRLSREELVAELVRIVRRELRLSESFDPAANLQQNGLDSLALTRVLLAVEEGFGVWIDESRLTPETLENVQTLAACVDELLDA